MWEICYEKSEILSEFIKDVSESRNRDFFSGKSREGWRGTCLLSRGETFEWVSRNI